MNDLFPSATQDILDQARRQPAYAIEETPGEAFNSAWKTTQRYTNVLAWQNNLADATQDWLDSFQQKTGEQLPNPYRAPWNPLAWDISKQIEQLNDVRARTAAKSKELNDPSLAFPDENTLYQAGVGKAREALVTQAQLASGQTAFGTGIASVAGSFGGSMTDPMNLGLNAIAIGTMPEGGGLIRSLIGAGVNFGLQGATEEALTYGYKRTVTPEYGPGSAAESVAMAALGGIAFEAGGKALGSLWRRARINPEIAEAMPMALQDAAQTAERAADIDANNPFRTGIDGEAAHNEAIVRIEADMLAGHVPELPEAAAREGNARIGEIHVPREASPLELVDQHSRAQNPDLFAKTDDLEGQIAQARAALNDVLARQNEAPNVAGSQVAARITDLEGQLATFTGRRRVSPSANAIRDQIAQLREASQSLDLDQASRDARQVQLLRERLNELQSDRARLGPDVKAARDAAANDLGVPLDYAQAIDAAPSHSGRTFEPVETIEGATEQPSAAPVVAQPAASQPASFRTAQGSSYVLHSDGTTTRTKAARNTPGHEGDSGLKARTERTIYVDPKVASALSSAGLSNLGEKGARLAIKDGKASLLTWNNHKSRWGSAPSAKNISFADTPEVGKSPLELWGKASDVDGFEAYSKQHAGNAITRIEQDAPTPKRARQSKPIATTPVTEPEAIRARTAAQVDRATGQAPNRTFFGTKSLRVRYELAEARDLIASHGIEFNVNPDYPAALQPRDRNAAAAREQVMGIASNLQPERLGPSVEANAGAPIIGPDNIVESGNGRTIALQRVNNEGSAAYRAFLERQGFDTTGFREPVLVGRRVSSMSEQERAAFAHAANGSASLRMSATEQALSDARHIDAATASLLQSGAVDTLANRDFVRAFAARLPQGERGSMMTKNGQLSAGGVNRVKAALVARAYGDADVVARAFDHPEPNIKTIASALVDAAPDWIKMRDAVTSGAIKAGQDITDDMMTAVRTIMRARDERRPIGEMLAQGDMFDSDTAALAARLFFKDGSFSRVLSKADMAENLNTFARNTLTHRDMDDNLFGEAPPSTRDVLAATVRRSDQQQAAIIAALKPEAIERAANDPAVHAAAEADLQRQIEQGRNRVPVEDAEGNVTLGFADKELADIEADLSAAAEIKGCTISPAAAAE